MKKLLLSLVLVLSSVVMFAQSNMREVVYLKNGSVIKGVILEQVPNESIKVQTADGSVFVYPMADVERITKETVETQVQTQVEQNSSFSVNGLMERDGCDLVIRGRELSDEELKALLSEDCYETYLSARKQFNTGNGFLIPGWITFGSAITLAFVSGFTGGDELMIPAYVLELTADVLLPLGFIFKGIGKGRINWVAEDYNRNQNKNYSFNVAPSIMKCNAPSAENNMALGMTFSLNF